MNNAIYPHHKNRDGVLVLGNRVRFVESDRALYAKHFARVGISLKNIKTTKDFDLAWEKSRPYLSDHLQDIAKLGMTRSKSTESKLEANALMAIVLGDYDKAKHLLKTRETCISENKKPN